MDVSLLKSSGEVRLSNSIKLYQTLFRTHFLAFVKLLKIIPLFSFFLVLAIPLWRRIVRSSSMFLWGSKSVFFFFLGNLKMKFIGLLVLCNCLQLLVDSLSNLPKFTIRIVFIVSILKVFCFYV